MKRLSLSLLMLCLMAGCSNNKDSEALQQMQYAATHTAYANSAALQYALDHQITPDSAVVVLGGEKK